MEKTFGIRYPEGLSLRDKGLNGRLATTKDLFNMLDIMVWIFAGMLRETGDFATLRRRFGGVETAFCALYAMIEGAQYPNKGMPGFEKNFLLRELVRRNKTCWK
jgi:hypothetical protein